MESSEEKRVDLRIRFAGLCLFVPDAANNVVHVLMPRTEALTADHAHVGHDVGEHQICIHWVSNKTGESRDLNGKRLVLDGPGWDDPDVAIDHVFEIKKIQPASGCPNGGQGKADPDTAPAAAKMELYAGRSKIINRGARWKISKDGGSKHPMPTVLDWRVKNILYSDLQVMLQGWDVFGTTLPDSDDSGTVNLWIIHAPEKDQQPGKITSKPDFDVGPPHFAAYYTLLTCGKYDVQPEHPELEGDIGDPERPGWPGPKSFAGMLVNCMLAKADIA